MAKILENSDGSVVVQLSQPIGFGEDTHERVTIPALTARHLKLMHWGSGEIPNIAQLCDFASKLVQPAGIFDFLTAADGLSVSNAAGIALGKAFPTGDKSSS